MPEEKQQRKKDNREFTLRFRLKGMRKKEQLCGSLYRRALGKYRSEHEFYVMDSSTGVSFVGRRYLLSAYTVYEPMDGASSGDEEIVNKSMKLK